MIAARAFASKTVAVFGLARTGPGAVRALVAGGARVIAWDDKASPRDAGRPGRRRTDARGANGRGKASPPLILSPGVPLTHPKPHDVVEHAARRRRARDRRCRTVRARDRDDGKAAPGHRHHRHQRQIHHHRADRAYPRGCGFDAQIGGNIGKSVLELAPPGAKTIYVLEMSSFQIDLAPGLTPDVARPVQPDARPYRPPWHAWRIMPPSRRGLIEPGHQAGR